MSNNKIKEINLMYLNMYINYNIKNIIKLISL